MEKLSFSEMEEVQGGIDPLIFGLCGAVHGAMFVAQRDGNVRDFGLAAALSDQLGCKLMGF